MISVESAVASPAQLRALSSELRTQPRSLVTSLLTALEALRAPSGELEREIWGSGPGDAQVHRAAAENLALGIARRRAVLEGSLTRAKVAERLGRTEQAVSAMLERGALLGLKEGREWRIPAWQLEPDLPRGVLPGLREVAEAYLDGVVSLSEWVHEPSPNLDGETPRTALARGRVDDVVRAARSE